MKRGYGLLMLLGDVIVGIITFAALRFYGVAALPAVIITVGFVSVVNIIAAFLTAAEYPYEDTM